MRHQFLSSIEKGRIRSGGFGSERGDRFGAFELHCRNTELFVIVSSGDEEINWEHVSVSIPKCLRCPTWEEMCFVKEAFWTDSETVLQFHPKRSEYVNQHPFTLHLWKLRGVDHKLPPLKCV